MGVANDNMDPNWLREELERPGRSQSDLARYLGFDYPSAVNRMVKGERQIKASEADKIREYLDTHPPRDRPATTRHGAQPRVEASLLSVRGAVQAGNWVEMAYQEAFEPSEFLPAPQFLVDSGAYALKVEGPSMDLHYPPGSYVVVQPQLGGVIPSGKHVIVEREREGDLLETTIKELVRSSDGEIQLWPKSRHPGHQTPLRYDDEDNAKVRIVGIVIWTITPVP